jgi:twitching motility protein PilU
MEQAAGEGCRTFDLALFELFGAGRITEEEALKGADSPNNLRLRIERFKAAGRAAATDDGEPPLRLVPQLPAAPEPARPVERPPAERRRTLTMAAVPAGRP